MDALWDTGNRRKTCFLASNREYPTINTPKTLCNFWHQTAIPHRQQSLDLVCIVSSNCKLSPSILKLYVFCGIKPWAFTTNNPKTSCVFGHQTARFQHQQSSNSTCFLASNCKLSPSTIPKPNSCYLFSVYLKSRTVVLFSPNIG